jgi:hypothetical protein
MNPSVIGYSVTLCFKYIPTSHPNYNLVALHPNSGNCPSYYNVVQQTHILKFTTGIVLNPQVDTLPVPALIKKDDQQRIS